MAINKHRIVTSYTGIEIERQYVKYIRDKYYIPNEECFYIRGQWYRINSGKIVYDHRIKRWRLSSDGAYVTGVVDINHDKPDKPFIIGDFSPDPLTDISVAIGQYQHKVVPGLDSTIFKGKLDFKESPLDFYYLPSFIKNPDIIRQYITIPSITNQSSYYPNIPYEYGVADLLGLFIPKFKPHTLPGSIPEVVRKYTTEEYLPYTFGVEFETNKGAIPQRYLFQYGLIPCRDGSINSFEYATIPLGGETGILALHKHCQLLQQFCRLNYSDSVHIHLGGYPRTKQKITALYKLCVLLQDDLYKLSPPAYRHTSSFKRRDYCNALDYIPTSTSPPYNFPKIFQTLLGEGMTEHFSSCEVTEANHPRDLSGRHKWNVNERYKIINFVPLIWGNRGTIEFRSHVPTMSYTKIIYWLYICSAILQYAEKHTDFLLSRLSKPMKNLTLIDVVKDIYPKILTDPIIEYINARTQWYSTKIDEVGNMETDLENENLTNRRNTPANTIHPKLAKIIYTNPLIPIKND